MMHIATLGSILDFSSAENLASFSLQDGASERLDYVENPTQPATNRLTSCTLLWVRGASGMYGRCL